ncbi:NADH-quinone oxidoreductase subunit NuoG [Pelagibacteraceae bacterium]|nr:NADH-quinone oxidoreductase subunit NuoG [Pelagibacteraceae bacterium]
MKMPKIIINGKEIEFEKGMTILQACELADVEIPRFCYHEKLSIAGNCRMCLVEMEKSKKPIASCAMPASEGMNIKTNTEFVEKARKGMMEFLLANHPLDCPVCDQGGECDLQDQSLYYGVDKSRFSENKRSVSDKYMGPLIKTQMTRCIHCTRCVRFATEVAGVPEIGSIGRGEDMEITTYLEKSMESELSANVIDLCPVGALTSKPYAFEARPWELKKTESIDVLDAVGSNIRVDTYGWEVKRILPRLNEDINEEWISDKTRYSCDGLLKQRLDVPYIKKDNKLVKASWDEAIELIKQKIKKFKPEEIAGHVGDMSSLESITAFKKLFKIINSSNLEFREKKFYINPEEKINYIFNTSIKRIEESDLILLIGTNPRYEATMVNARIRKAFKNNKTKIFSIGDPGELTYDYEIIGTNTQDLFDIINKKNNFSDKFLKSKKPLIIIGESALEMNSGKFIFEEVKNFLKENNFINNEWNALNVLIQNSTTVGAIDLGLYSIEKENNFLFFENLKNNKFKLLYLLGSDNLEIDKNDKFIIYQGSHGDKGAEIADIILPSPAYTEKDGLYINLEGRTQYCRKASYPTGEAMEDWKIFNLITKSLNGGKLINDSSSLQKEALSQIKNFSEINNLPNNNLDNINVKKVEFKHEEIKINKVDYYFSNYISRASKTMSECRSRRVLHFKKNGTNN